jgi:hypothetical protein
MREAEHRQKMQQARQQPKGDKTKTWLNKTS